MLPPGSEDREPAALLELMLAGFARAHDAAAGPDDRCYRFGDRVVRIRFAGSEVADALGPVLEHVRTDGSTVADATLHCFDSSASGEPVSPLVQLLLDRIDLDWHAWLTPRHEIRGIGNERVPTAFEPWSGILSAFDRDRRTGVWWIRDAAEVPSHERAAPLRTLLGWALADLGLQSVHAAAVGRASGGVLLAGPGGSGKSSTALRCLAGGLDHLADDYCLISTSGPPRAYSLFAVAKLDGADDLTRLPEFRTSVVNADRQGAEKLVVDLRREFAERIIATFPIRAVVAPTVRPAGPTTLAPLDPAAALRALGPTTLLQLPGSGTRALHAMGDLVRRVPCHTLYLGDDGADVPALVSSLLDQ